MLSMPRFRISRTRLGIDLCALVLAVWFASGCMYLGLHPRWRWTVVRIDLSRGVLVLGYGHLSEDWLERVKDIPITQRLRQERGKPLLMCGGEPREFWGWDWGFRWFQRGTPGTHISQQLQVPLWAVLLAVVIPTSIVWR